MMTSPRLCVFFFFFFPMNAKTHFDCTFIFRKGEWKEACESTGRFNHSDRTLFPPCCSLITLRMVCEGCRFNHLDQTLFADHGWSVKTDDFMIAVAFC